MALSEFRPNWLSEIIEAKRHAGEGPIPLVERKAERDAIVSAIQAHPEGQSLAALPNLADVVWEALGAAYHWQRDAQQNPHLMMSSPAIYASLFILNVARPSPD